MSSLLTLFYILLASSITVMSSPSVLSRLRARLSSQPQLLEAPKSGTEQAQDRDALQKSISDAVAAALNNEEFTKAVANHLAIQLQPSLKAALDISAVESKLLASNEQLTQRINDTNTQTSSKISKLSALVDTSNTTTTDKLSALDGAVTKITDSLVELGNAVKHG